MADKIKIQSVLPVLLGGGSFLMILPQLWWIGFACAIAGLITGMLGLKSDSKKNRVCCVTGVILCAAGAVCCVVTEVAMGFVFQWSL